MSDTYLIGVDIGTQGTKSALYDAEGRCLAESFEASELLHPVPGATEQDPEAMLASVYHTIRELMDRTGLPPAQVAAVGIDAQMAGILGVGRDGLAVTPYDSWLDTRCEPYISRMKETAEPDILRLTGGQVTYAHGPKILWWQRERPEAYERIAKFVTPSAYVTMRMAGLTAKEAYMDVTHLHFTGFADTLQEKWDDGLLAAFAVDRDKMPRICRPAEMVGRLTPEAAAACGLAPGTPLAAGCGDSAASSFGAGMVEKGLAYDVAGTASIFSYITDEYRPDTKHKTILFTHSVVDGLWNAMAYIGGGGMCLHWFRQLSGRSYRDLDRMAAETEPGCGGLLFLPHFAGRTCPNLPSMKGSWLGLDWQHGTAELYRSILEGVAYEYHLYLSILRELDPTISPVGIYGAGGGARSEIFNKIKADVLGLPLFPLRMADTATFGSAMIAGACCGVISDLRGAVLRNRVAGQPVRPDDTHAAVYAEMAAAYRRALDRAGALYPLGIESNDRKG